MEYNKITNSVSTFLLALFMITVFIPIFSSEVSCVIMAAIILMGLLFYQIKANKISAEFFLFVIILIFYYVFDKGINFNFNGILIFVLYLVSSFISFSILKKLTKGQIDFLILVILMLVIYSNISTIYISAINPMAVRKFGYSMTSLDEEILKSTRTNGLVIYSYGVGEALAIICPFLISYAFKNTNKKISVLCFISVLLSIFSQIMAALSTSLFLTILFCSLTVLSFIKTEKTYKKFEILLVALIIIIVSWPFLISAFENNPALLERTENIRFLFANRSATGDLEMRFDLYIQSIKAWLHNPVLGLADVGSLNIKTGVSMHTAFFDFLGLYGLFSILLFHSWISTFIEQFKSLNRNKRNYYKWGLFSLIFLLVLKGPVTLTINFYFSFVLCGIIISAENRNSSIKSKTL